jgi:hypothetical protein
MAGGRVEVAISGSGPCASGVEEPKPRRAAR